MTDDQGSDSSSTKEDPDGSTESSIHALSTRKFEALESEVSRRLLALAASQKHKGDEGQSITERTRTSSRREKVIRGLKVGGAGIAAGALFAITGGLAAPALAAGIAAIAGGTVVASIAIMALSSVAAVTTVFGVGGGGLIAAKMMKRTEGLSEFQIKQETYPWYSNELSRCVCISGWLRDMLDFQRPWGVTPDDLTMEELMVRFYSVYAPDVVPECALLLEQWKGRENKLWEALREKYGRDPYNLLPLEGPRQSTALTKTEKAWLGGVIEGLGFNEVGSSLDRADSRKCHTLETIDGEREPSEPTPVHSTVQVPSASAPVGSESCQISPFAAWDYQAEYAGELYTLKWESNLLLQIGDSVKVRPGIKLLKCHIFLYYNN